MNTLHTTPLTGQEPFILEENRRLKEENSQLKKRILELQNIIDKHTDEVMARMEKLLS